MAVLTVIVLPVQLTSAAELDVTCNLIEHYDATSSCHPQAVSHAVAHDLEMT